MARDNVDERVVQLMLDSKEFDSNAKKSIQSLDDLKKALEFEGSSKGFEAIERAARKVDFSIMDNGIQKVQDHFNLLNTVATTAIERITNSAIDSGTRLVKALSVDQITQGWSQFEDRTTAMQRIMSATTSQFSDEKEQIEAVNEQMEKLVWFTDETSYKYLDIVNSIGKFTSNNIDLKESVKAMEGISTWASLSGASIEESGRAMYNLAQAMSVGAVKLQDWKSIENANMATYEFKQTAIETAVALGTLTQDMYGYYHAGNKAFQATELFSDGLKQGWFDAEVLMATLSRYGGFTDLLNEFMNAVEEEGFYTASALSIIDDYVDGHLDMADAMEQTGMSAEELTSWLEKLGSEEMELGRKGFKAAQETKTLSEAIDYIKTAVSSGWAQSFQYIFGDYNEAKKWWSEVSEALYSVFVESGEARNELLKFWKEAGGRDVLLDGIRTLAKNIYGVIESIKGAWNNIFGKEFDEQVESLLNLTYKFREFAESITFTDGTFRDFLRILESVFRVLKTIGRVVGTVISALEPAGRMLNKLAGLTLNLIANLAELLSLKLESLFDDRRLQAVYDVLSFIATLIAYLASGVLNSVFEAFNLIIGAVDGFFTVFSTTSGGIEGIIETLIWYIRSFWEEFLAGNTIANTFVETFITILGGAVAGVKILIDTIVKLFTGKEINLSESFGDVAGWFTAVSETIEKLNLSEKFSVIQDIIASAIVYVKNLFIELQTADSSLRQLLGSVQNEIISFYNWFKKAFADLTAGDIADLALVTAITLIIFEMKKLVKTTSGLISSISGVVGTFNKILKQGLLGESVTFMDRLSSIFDKTKIIQIGLSAVLLVAALNEFNKLDVARTTQSIIMIGAICAILVVALKKFQQIQKEMPKKESGENKIALYILEISAGLLLASKALTEVAGALEGEDGTKRMLAAMASLGLVLAAMTGVTQYLSKIDFKDLSKAASTMIGMSIALAMMVVPLKAIAALDWLDALQGTVAIVALLASMGAAAKLMEKVDWKSLLAVGFSFMSISTAMVILSAAMYTMSMALNSDSGGLGLVGVAGSIVALAMAISVLGQKIKEIGPATILAMSVALISFGTAIDLLAVGMLALQGVDFLKMAGTMAVFTVALIGLLNAANGAAGATGPLLALSAVIISFGATVALFGIGVRSLAEAFAILVTVVTTLGVVANEMGDEMPSVIQKGLFAIEDIIVGFLQMIPRLIPDLIVATASLIGGIVTGVLIMLPSITAAFLQVGAVVCEVIAQFGGPFAQALTKAIYTLNEYLPEFMAAVGVFVENFLSGVGIIIRHAAAGLGKMIYAAITGKEVTSQLSKGTSDVMDNIAAGIDSGGKNVYKSAKEVGEQSGKEINKSFKDSLGIHSPSLEMIKNMLFAALGLEQGANKYTIPMGISVGDATGNAIVDAAKTATYSGMDSLGADLAAWKEQMMKEMDFSSITSSSEGLFTWSSRKYKDYGAGQNRDNSLAAQITKDQEALAKKVEEDSSPAWFDAGSGLADSLNKGVGSGGSSTKEEKEKTAEEIVNEYLQAIQSAYSRGVDRLDVSASRLSLKDKLWNLTNKEPGEKATDAEKQAYELAKKTHQVEMLDQQMSAQLMKINLAEADYREKLNILGSEAIETQKAYNSLLEEQYNILDLYSQKQELMAEESESTADDFIAASKEIASYRELVEQNLITEEMMMNAAKDKLKAFRKEESDFAKTHTTELDNVMSGILEKLPEYGYDLNKAFGTIVTENFIEAFDNAGENTEGLENSLVETVVKTIETATNDPKLIEASEGSGINYVQGLVSGTEKMKGAFVDASQVVAKDGLNAMAKELDINSPSRKTDQFGQWLDEGLANGLLNDGAVTKVLNAADTIARKLLARLKAKLGVNSPSTETYAIAKWLDVGAANGITDYSSLVMKSSDKMVGNLLDNMKSQIAQNGSEMKAYLKDSFGLADDDLRFTIIVDADTSLADASLTELERAYAIYNSGNVQLPNLVSQGANMRDLYSRLNESDTYRASELQSLYDLVDSYVSYQKRKESRDAYEEESKPEASSISFTQNNYSPRSISALDTYRNTKKQLSTFEQKFKDIRIRK